MFLPFRAKNPPEKTPYVTISLIAINVLVYLCTTEYFLVIRQSVLDAAGVSHDTLSIGRLFTSMFLHESPEHIIGNMLFLWIFGPSLEGRIGYWKYLFLYLTTGMIGGLTSDLIVGVGHPDMYSLGASGAIMGVIGAYVWLFPYAQISILRFTWWRLIRGYELISNWHARWVVLYYILYNVIFGSLGVALGAGGGVGYFAHLGGAAAGLLLVVVLGAHRDTLEHSDVKAILHDKKDFSLMKLMDLETLLTHPNPDPNLIAAYCEKALMSGESRNQEKALETLLQHSRVLIEQGDAAQIAEMIVRMPPSLATRIPTVFLLRLGSRLERVHANEPAVQMYYMIKDLSPNSPDCEVALHRMGRLAENVYQAPDQAREFYQEILKRFPSGTMALEAQRSLAGLSSRANYAPGGNKAG